MSTARKMLPTISRLGQVSASCFRVRQLSTSATLCAITKFTMPAMSPTMTAGGLAAWKVKEGQAFSAGDVLLEIETDKATMDVEAQDDGVLAKIVVQDGAKDVSVGNIIAMLAEEGDDISNVEVPKDEQAPKQDSKSASSEQDTKKTTPSETESKSVPQSSSQTGASTTSAAPSSSGSSTSNTGSHSSFKGPMFPSVQRLIAENHIEQAETKIKGTGIRGMITKGDVLAFLGQAKSPTGTFKESQGGIAILGPKQASPKGSSSGASSGPVEPLSGDALRSLILGGLAAASKSARQPAPQVVPAPLSAPFAQHVVNSAAEDHTSASAASVLRKAGSVRKEGIRSDDPLWYLI